MHSFSFLLFLVCLQHLFTFAPLFAFFLSFQNISNFFSSQNPLKSAYLAVCFFYLTKTASLNSAKFQVWHNRLNHSNLYDLSLIEFQQPISCLLSQILPQFYQECLMWCFIGLLNCEFNLSFGWKLSFIWSLCNLNFLKRFCWKVSRGNHFSQNEKFSCWTSSIQNVIFYA